MAIESSDAKPVQRSEEAVERAPQRGVDERSPLYQSPAEVFMHARTAELGAQQQFDPYKYQFPGGRVDTAGSVSFLGMTSDQEQLAKVRNGEGAYQGLSRLLGNSFSHQDKMTLAETVKDQYKADLKTRPEYKDRDAKAMEFHSGDTLLNKENAGQVLASLRAKDPRLAERVEARLANRDPAPAAESTDEPRRHGRHGREKEKRADGTVERASTTERSIDRAATVEKRTSSELAERVIDQARSSEGKKLWTRDMKNGYLGCASAVSQVLNDSGVDTAHSPGVANLSSQLKAHGWKKDSWENRRAGDVIVGSSHVGIYVSDKETWDNKSKSGTWQKDPASYWERRHFKELYVLHPPDRTADVDAATQPRAGRTERARDAGAAPNAGERIDKPADKVARPASDKPDFGGVASFYHEPQRMANGKRFDPMAMTAAHKTLPFGTRLEVTTSGGKAELTVTDRGPYREGRSLDVSLAAARKLGMEKAGTANYTAKILEMGDGHRYPDEGAGHRRRRRH